MKRLTTWASTLAVLALVAFPALAQAAVRPNPVGEIDCNGFSPIQTPAHPTAMCADVHGTWGGRFWENGHYIGHDEPAVRFISNAPGSGEDITFVERLGTDPRALPTVRNPGNDITHWFELSIAPWFSTDVCDPNSAPMLPCKPESDSNAPTATSPGGGAGFVELQFYPPGFAPFVDSISCDNTHWCSALNIDSLECNPDGSNCNNDCPEPVNFAFIQRDGQPTGPPSPQLSDATTFTPNRQTLLMNPGDVIVVHMFDVTLRDGRRALETSERDLTNGQSGFMIASAANGFMNTARADCSGTPFDFAAEYSSAAAGNILPWGAGPYMVDTQFEIGHFEPCRTVTGLLPAPDPVWSVCNGPYEPTADATQTSQLEPNDAPCYPFGDTHGGTAAPNLVSGCIVGSGDLEYDGTPYYADWPTSIEPGRFPGAFAQLQPISRGRTYPQIQFETDNAATQFETGCDLNTGANCVLPPPGPGNFYPYWTLSRQWFGCTWEFGNVRDGNTFGGDAQYGQVSFNPPGAFTSPIERNPSCFREHGQ